jgi:hypothetical protein
VPGIGCNALNSYQLVVGCDWHKQIPPPPPIGPVPAAHLVAYFMGFAMPATSKESPTVKVGWGSALGRQHDLGIGIYHFAGNFLLSLVWASASNKAEFGSSTVQIPTGRIAVALIPGAGLNPQLDCNDVPCPAPTSLCVATLNTVKVGFTWSDCAGGFAAMAFDSAFTYLISTVIGKGVPKAFFPLAGALSRNSEAILALRLASPRVEYAIMKGIEIVMGMFVTTPLGYSRDLPWNKWGKINDSINDYLAPPPSPERPPAAPLQSP